MNKKVLRFILILATMVAIVVFANITMRNLNVSAINIEIEYGGKDELIGKADVTKMLQSKFGDISKKKRKEIKSEEIEEYLVQRNFISAANVYLTLGGDLKLEIEQSNPIVRVCNSNGYQFYIDTNKQVCKLKKGRAANVIVASGELQGQPKLKEAIDSVSYPVLNDVYKIVELIEQDEVLKNQIDQIYYSKKDKFQLLPKVGDYVILLGGIDSLEGKLKKLHYLYKDGFVKHGWDNYSFVDLTFINQVVCTRK